MRIVVRVLIGLVALVALFAVFAYARSELALRHRYAVAEPALALPTDADALARGQRIATTRGCTDCHGRDLAGNVIMEEPPIGRLAGPNLTRGQGGLPASFGAPDWERAIRHGLAPDGRGLLFMPARDFAGLSDADTADLIAYLQSVPPVDKPMAPAYVGPVGRALFAIGQLPMIDARYVDHAAKHVATVEKAPTAEYGRYLAQGCTGCHGQGFSGGAVPGVPPSYPKAANLTPDAATGLGHWKKEDFYRLLREGKRPDGRSVDAFMPWKALSHFDDVELDALWAYLQTLPARPFGHR